MLTRLEISGFKSFTDFEVDFAPLTIIAGANASGKSNLIEALRLVQGLAQRRTFGSGFTHQRNLEGLFTKYDAKTSAKTISVAVEIKLPWNYINITPETLLDYNCFRYEVEITNNFDDPEGEWFEISKERLVTTQHTEALPFINYGYDTTSQPEKSEFSFGYVRDNLTWTSLSEVSFAGDIHIYACQRALRSIVLTDLISPDNFSNQGQHQKSNETIDAEGILSSLVRFKKTSSDQLHYLSQRLRRIVKDLISVDVYTDDYNRSTVTATDTEGRSFLASNLSEGTLRIIALASYLLKRKNDQVLLIEEPENGIDPRRITEMLILLLDLSVNRAKHKEEYWQVICTTHSPILLQAALNIEDQEKIAVLLTNKVGYLSSIGEKRYKLKATRMNPIIPKESINGSTTALELYTLREAMDYLSPITEEKITEDA